MTEQEYYRSIFPQLERTFAGADYVIAAGTELIKHGWDPNGLLVSVEPLAQLEKLACEWGLQVHVPVIGMACERVLLPLDFEISLTNENYHLYADKQTQHHYFTKYALPTIDYLENLFIDRGLPFLLDLTPSGGHILFWVEKGTAPWPAVAALGHLEADLEAAYRYADPGDIKRGNGIDLEAGLVFSGLGRLSEFLGYKLKNALQRAGEIPVTICDTEEKSINFDNSWAGDAAFMRGIRSPFSLHKKNIQKYQMYWQPPLVDVIKTSNDEHLLKRTKGFEFLLDCMWDLEKAAVHAEEFSGMIPAATDTLLGLIAEYRDSGLFEFHQSFDGYAGLERGEAYARAAAAAGFGHEITKLIENPYPSLLQPWNLKRFIRELVVSHTWHPSEVGDLLRDIYEHPRHSYWGQMDWYKSPSATKANYYARLYGGMALWEDGRLKLKL